MSDNSEKNNQGTVEAAVPEPRKRGCAAHCKRFWWAYLIGFIVVVLVVVLPVIYVGYPNIAQRDVNRSTLEITEMEITDPAPESFHIRLTQVIGSKSKYHPILDAFNADVSLPDNEQPFLKLDVPSVKAVDGAVAKIDQDVSLPNADAFAAFSLAVMKQEDVSMIIHGRTGLREGSLPKTTVNYDKTVTLKGLNGLKGFNVTDFDLITPALDDGTNMRGNVFIPNPSVMTLTMGNLTLNLSVDGEPIGQSFMNNVVIRPGDNNVEMTSKVNQAKVLGLIAGRSAPYRDGILPIEIVGESARYNGEDLPYYTKALASNRLHVDLNVGAVLFE
ncbi:hypothetical protein D8B26_008116 [Coccidioides posadasii str. Silveira]|uniref:Uncharacterized protein n=2 Tax=Coccidioides posadasii TaxID=199306 RepID=E9DDW6_COCPS|nr:hypothetical protein CPC735_070840 [Coccidioides posadasii C735 delta SOWgp]EER29402.1 hypothetical protein CPC735_070840 [Coccidioides posadasii C735 delta SOWgp]EFW15321.1 conserved hypothetical protein [Coccidioides posadasii str. Silveira]QVM13508.1 hypothetical protein D8B26_008116 [Coccidioides posadasii str. Silveira]|eukprot:XP_003071547.1 hypothetical protein CPC735_070840 [Coccidioides posadasii C735 delta SOWgp]